MELKNVTKIANSNNTKQPPTKVTDGNKNNNIISHFQSNRVNIRRKRCSDYIPLNEIKKLQRICEIASESMKEDEFDIFGRHIASQLRNMNIFNAIDVQTQINNIVSIARIQDIKDKNKKENSNQTLQT